MSFFWGSMRYGAGLLVLAVILVALRFPGMLPGSSSATAAKVTVEQPLPQPKPAAPGSASIRLLADRNGHFISMARINKVPIEVMVDTGASIVALSWESAAKAGLKADPNARGMRIGTANGAVTALPVKIPEVRIGELVVTNVEAVILPPGALQGHTLLGMSFLKKVRMEMQAGQLILRQ